jgi:hypothetical protein
MARLRERDLLKSGNRTIRGRLALSSAGHFEREADDAKRWRVELVKWLANQMTEVGEEIAGVQGKIDTGVRHHFTKPELTAMQDAQEEAEHNFVETGRTDGQLILHR